MSAYLPLRISAHLVFANSAGPLSRLKAGRKQLLVLLPGLNKSTIEAYYDFGAIVWSNDGNQWIVFSSKA